tara:strand:+ start:35 stop:643 length:609 start_codon:yes stop_codon:yes gene_type:complete
MRGLLESKKHTKNKKKDRIKMTRFRKIESISLSNEEFFEIKKGRFSKKGIDYVERSVDLIDPVPHVMPVELNRFSIFSSLSQTRFCLKKDHADRLQRLVPERSILLSTISSSLGKASLCINPVSINQFVVGVIIKDKSILLPRYVLYMAGSARTQLHLMAKGGVGHVTFNEILSLSIPLLNLERQREIIEKFENTARSMERT